MISNPVKSQLNGRITAQFSAVCAEFRSDAVPAEIIQRAKLIMLDTLGAMLSASRPSFRGTQLLSRFVAQDCEGGRCGIVGTSIRSGATNAALMNGYLGYGLDIESHHGEAVAHAAAAVLPAVLAIGQQTGASGASLLAALVLGIEVDCRVSLSIGANDLYERGFHPTSVAGTFGAAAAAGHLLQCNAAEFERALGLAATETGGLLAWASDQTEESRPFNPGLAARNGVTAAHLAHLGFGGPQGIFDEISKYNVYRAWALDGRGRPQELLEQFGERFAITELIIKRHACCAFLHPGLDGLLSILQEDGVTADQITSITMRYPRSGAPIIDNNELRSHRAQYILPVASVRGEVCFEDVIEDRSVEPEIQRLSTMTTLVHDDELDRTYPEKYATIIDVTTNDGRVHRRRVDFALGCPENPMTDDAIRAKFRRLAGQRVSSERVEQIERVMMQLDERGNAADVMEAVTVS